MRCRTARPGTRTTSGEITTTDYTPAQIHAMGLDEVARIHGEMRRVMKQVGFKGVVDEFFEFIKTDPQFFSTTTGRS